MFRHRLFQKSHIFGYQHTRLQSKHLQPIGFPLLTGLQELSTSSNAKPAAERVDMVWTSKQFDERRRDANLSSTTNSVISDLRRGIAIIQSKPSEFDNFFHGLISKYGSEKALYVAAVEATSGVSSLPAVKTSVSRVKYKDIAALVGWYPSAIDLFHAPTFSKNASRLPKRIIKDIFVDLNKKALVFGLIEHHKNEETLNRFIAAIFDYLTTLFSGAIANVPELFHEGKLTGKGRIENLYLAFGVTACLYIEVKTGHKSQNEVLDNIAQVLAESLACDYHNEKLGYFLPISGCLLRAHSFYFVVYDPYTGIAYQSGRPINIPTGQIIAAESARTLQHLFNSLFDFFLCGYINSLEAVSRRTKLTIYDARDEDSRDDWGEALRYARQALEYGRQAAELAAKQNLEIQTEDLSEAALDHLSRSLAAIPKAWQPDMVWMDDPAKFSQYLL